MEKKSPSAGPSGGPPSLLSIPTYRQQLQNEALEKRKRREAINSKLKDKAGVEELIKRFQEHGVEEDTPRKIPSPPGRSTLLQRYEDAVRSRPSSALAKVPAVSPSFRAGSGPNGPGILGRPSSAIPSASPKDNNNTASRRSSLSPRASSASGTRSSSISASYRGGSSSFSSSFSSASASPFSGSSSSPYIDDPSSPTFLAHTLLRLPLSVSPSRRSPLSPSIQGAIPYTPVLSSARRSSSATSPKGLLSPSSSFLSSAPSPSLSSPSNHQIPLSPEASSRNINQRIQEKKQELQQLQQLQEQQQQQQEQHQKDAATALSSQDAALLRFQKAMSNVENLSSPLRSTPVSSSSASDSVSYSSSPAAVPSTPSLSKSIPSSQSPHLASALKKSQPIKTTPPCSPSSSSSKRPASASPKPSPAPASSASSSSSTPVSSLIFEAPAAPSPSVSAPVPPPTPAEDPTMSIQHQEENEAVRAEQVNLSASVKEEEESEEELTLSTLRPVEVSIDQYYASESEEQEEEDDDEEETEEEETETYTEAEQSFQLDDLTSPERHLLESVLQNPDSLQEGENAVYFSNISSDSMSDLLRFMERAVARTIVLPPASSESASPADDVVAAATPAAAADSSSSPSSAADNRNQQQIFLEGPFSTPGVESRSLLSPSSSSRVLNMLSSIRGDERKQDARADIIAATTGLSSMSEVEAAIAEGRAERAEHWEAYIRKTEAQLESDAAFVRSTLALSTQQVLNLLLAADFLQVAFAVQICSKIICESIELPEFESVLGILPDPVLLRIASWLPLDKLMHCLFDSPLSSRLRAAAARNICWGALAFALCRHHHHWLVKRRAAAEKDEDPTSLLAFADEFHPPFIQTMFNDLPASMPHLDEFLESFRTILHLLDSSASLDASIALVHQQAQQSISDRYKLIKSEAVSAANKAVERSAADGSDVALLKDEYTWEFWPYWPSPSSLGTPQYDKYILEKERVLLPLCVSAPIAAGAAAASNLILTAGISLLPNWFKCLTDLSLRGCADVSEETVIRVIQASPNLRLLDLAGATQCSDLCLQTIPKHLEHLEVLNLGGLRNITDFGFLALAKEMPRNTPLAAEGLKHDLRLLEGTYKVYPPPPPPAPPGLSSAVDANIRRQAGLFQQHLQQSYFPALRRLSIRGCTKLTNASLQAIGNTFQNLWDLCAYGVYRLSDDGVISLGNRNFRLRRLNVCGCYKISESGRRYIFSAQPGLILYNTPEDFEKEWLSMLREK